MGFPHSKSGWLSSVKNQCADPIPIHKQEKQAKIQITFKKLLKIK
jgi:hypothetical protein